MGWITKRKLESGLHLAHGAKVGKRAYPLRKIVSSKWWKPETAKDWEPEHQYELLECGHLGELISAVGTHLFGPQVASRRRCRECYLAKDKG